MVISDTLEQNRNGVERQVTMPALAYKTIKESKVSRKFSPGVVASEALMLAEPNMYGTDALTGIEEDIVTQLSDETGCSTSRIWDAIRSVPSNLDFALQIMEDYCEEDEDPDEKYKSVSIWVMPDLVDKLPKKGAAGPITDSLQYTIASPWSSRTERIEDLRELRDYVVSSTNVSSEFAESVVSGESERYDVDALHEIVSEVDREWHESPSLTIDVLKRRGTEIPKTSGKRIPALETALANDDSNYSPDKIKNTIENIYTDIRTESTITKYTRQVDTKTVNNGVEPFEIDISDTIEDLVEKSVLKTGGQTQRDVQDLTNSEVAGFTRPIGSIEYDKSVFKLWDAVENLAILRQHLMLDVDNPKSGIYTIRVENATEVADKLDEIQSEVQDHFSNW